ncbi:MAG: hypothetical protein FJ288_03705 [Planctomycetes bacterium]|nr:hypothetical protein [Planctomycetota bacterium]
MSDFTIWGIGAGASAIVVVAAVVIYAWYSYLKARLPLAVYYKDLESRVSDLKAKFTDLVTEVGRRRQEVGNLLQEKMTLEAEIGDARAWLEKNQVLLEQLPIKRAEIAETEEKLRRVRQEWLQVQAQRLDEEEKAATARREVERAQTEIAELKTYRDRLADRVAALQQQQRQLEVQVGKLELDTKRAADQLERLRAELAREEKRLSAIQEESKRAKAEQRETELARDEASAKKDSLLREIALKERDLGRLQREHETLSKKVEHFEQMVRAPSKAERLEDFTKPVIAVRSNIQPLQATGDGGERARLEECTRYFERNKYKFHARTLSAFHTSLKTADISPLVVLAGISGTGKSQLPRLYAEALGIHFLNVAVQPRWDAPQDLFGFYNYMEHRYKATELARALRQMDARRALDAGEDKRVRDGMLLVLLDEMNLARVEYYFSELLSKLEMRTVAGTGDGQARHPAAIEIDAGSLGRDDQPERLFVGHNVLFAGTMNEDETTQALSDKVIDRSNVLRFGKPGQLRKDKPPSVSAPEYYLRYEDWKSWLRPDLPAGEADQFGRICDRLNAVLARIHRPFGHRVHQAMYRYAANYPRWAADWFHCAMADQFEQKVIPRLRGLSRDTDEKADEVLDEIGALINGLHDIALAGAFGAARERPSAFQWAGVNREAEQA